MKLIIKIAWRNIQRHRGKSVIIGMILFLGAVIMTIGNGVITGMDNGLYNNMINGFTGDIVLISQEQEGDNVFLEFMGKAVEPICNYKNIKQVLKKQPFVADFLPIGKNVAMLLNDRENGEPLTSFIIGVDFGDYRRMFPDNMMSIEGEMLTEGERGTILPTTVREGYFNKTSIWFTPAGKILSDSTIPKEMLQKKTNFEKRSSIVYMGFNNDNSTSDIRLDVKGIVKYRALNRLFGQFALMDIESYRQCLGYFAAAEQSIVLSGEEQALLNLEQDDLDDLFTEEDISFTMQTTATVDSSTMLPRNAPSLETKTDRDNGAYNLVLIRLKDGNNPDKAIARLNDLFKQEELGIRAVSWKKAMGLIGSIVGLVRTAFLGLVALLFFVAIIIIVNTLSMAALERTSEIGMMRAVGARKGFIQLMFLGETVVLSSIFEGLGILTGMVIVKVISLFHFKSNNDILQLAFGGDVFNPFLTGADIVFTIILLVLVTVIAAIYPIVIAGNITPLDAISRD
jgi:putative ABC transport system permease protein